MYKTRHSLQLLIFFVLFLIQIFYICFKYPINYITDNDDDNDDSKQCSNNKLTNQISDRKQINCIYNRHGLKSVQVLTQFYDWQFWKDDFLGRKPFENCSQKACFAFRYHSSRQEALEESDGVIVHAPNLLYLPSRSEYKRNPRQLWSLFTIESQRYSFCLLHFTLKDLDDWFNLTKTVKDKFAYMTYDLKQLHRYDTYLNSFNKSVRLKKDDVVKSKPNKVIWFVSHCSTPSRREHVVHELRKHIDVDIYGRCGFIGSKSDPCRQASDPARCLIDLFNSYKFYLSFENSNCDSYITEKYFQFYETSLIFDVDIVPIVRGAKWSQYLERAPDEHSFIFAENFNSIKSLADYLNYLDRNDSAYREYFSWKIKLNERVFASLNQKQDEKSLLQPEEFSPMCDLCEKLHDTEYLKSSHTPVKISDIYNPLKDCSQETFSEKKLLKRLQDSTSCYWAEFHQRFKNFWHVYERLF